MDGENKQASATGNETNIRWACCNTGSLFQFDLTIKTSVELHDMVPCIGYIDLVITDIVGDDLCATLSCPVFLTGKWPRLSEPPSPTAGQCMT
jgi:hypothetical protein